MVANKGRLILFNSFLSTSKNHAISINFDRRALNNSQVIGVLIVMIIEFTRSSTPFAHVANVGYYKAAEDEILFSMYSVFRIRDITVVDDNPRLAQVQLNLTSVKDNDLCELIDYTREETFPNAEGWYRLGAVGM